MFTKRVFEFLKLSSKALFNDNFKFCAPLHESLHIHTHTGKAVVYTYTTACRKKNDPKEEKQQVTRSVQIQQSSLKVIRNKL